MNHFGVKIQVDPESGEFELVYFQFAEGTPTVTLEVEEGAVFAHYNKDKNLLGVEILGLCPQDVLNKAFRKVFEGRPQKVEKFVRRVIPTAMELEPA